MPKGYKKPVRPSRKRYKDMNATQRQELNQKQKDAGGWYLLHRKQRLERENKAENVTPNDRITTFRQRQYINRPHTTGGD